MSQTQFQEKAKVYVPGLQDPSTDALWIQNRNGEPSSWIDSDGFPGGNLYRAILTAIGPASVVQNSLLAVNTNTAEIVSDTAVATSLYNIALFMESYGTGGGGTTVVATIFWTNAQGNLKTVALTLALDSDQIQQENYVMLAKAGTSISVSTAFSGAAAHYDIAAAISILPTAGA